MKTAYLLTGNAAYLDRCIFAARLLRAAGATSNIYIFTDDSGSLAENSSFHLRILAPESRFDTLPAAPRLGRYAFWRIDAIEQLSREYDRILYLDADVCAVNDSPESVFQIDLHDRPLAAAYDFFEWLRPWLAPREFRRIGYNDAPYFNSGVLLVDCRAWLAEDVIGKSLSIAGEHLNAITRADQSLLNLVFYKRWTEISPIWNWQYSAKSSLLMPARNSRLVHFCGIDKPWSDETGNLPDVVRHAWDKSGDGIATCEKLELAAPTVRMNHLAKNLAYAPLVTRLKRRFPNAAHSVPV